MAENMGKWPSGHGQLTKIRLSDGCGGKTITTAAQFEYDHHGFEGYLGNVGFVLVRRVTGDKIVDRLHDFAGTGRILKTSLDKDSEEELRNVFEKVSA